MIGVKELQYTYPLVWSLAITPCSPSPCMNGAACVPLSGACDGFACQCVGCFQGQFCENGKFLLLV